MWMYSVGGVAASREICSAGSSFPFASFANAAGAATASTGRTGSGRRRFMADSPMESQRHLERFDPPPAPPHPPIRLTHPTLRRHWERDAIARGPRDHGLPAPVTRRSARRAPTRATGGPQK
jgi:hypothetical protein